MNTRFVMLSWWKHRWNCLFLSRNEALTLIRHGKNCMRLFDWKYVFWESGKPLKRNDFWKWRCSVCGILKMMKTNNEWL
jgi:hypothetical protein